MSQILLAVFVIFSLDIVNSQYVPPQATVLPLRPIGIKISIPDEEGISLVAYHVKFNKEFIGLEAGTIARDITKARNGTWTYEDRSTKLKDGDVIYYWVHVVYEGLGYNLLEQQHIVNEFFDYNGVSLGGSANQGNIGGNDKCPSTMTKAFKITDEISNICRGDLIFEETFDDQNEINELKWTIMEKFPGSPDYEFVVYRNHKENVKVVDGKLIITPILLDNTCGSNFVENGSLTLERCTGMSGTRECQRKSQGFLILPPVISGRVDTKNAFYFQYGRIEIRAKMPRGDWIYPLLMLEPLDKKGDYTTKDATFYYQLRVASALGNPELKSATGQHLSGHILRGGFLSRTELHTSYVTTLKKNDSTVSKSSNELWSNDYHTYEMEWKLQTIILKVDGQKYGEMDFNWPVQTPFYITLGVAVGGSIEFPDGCESGKYKKPWDNFKSKALLNFYRTQSTWFDTWKSGTSLEVDYIKVWAV